MIAGLQALLRRAFMAIEAVFNRAFGDALNPFYHLGAIVFWLFWLIAGSGLYLYAFFETGVTGAYQSVQALTDTQWWLGGVLRSVHRYASDAMVLLMLLHMLRHFAFDRLRGFRSFSWLTGVVLIVLVYAAGINGYMLPWDRLAQYVAVASFEWLEWLPGFGGTLMRNFIYPENVTNRLFSLLSFIHIGAPLLVLLLMWVHVQRVPKAVTQPPRVIALGLLVLMLALAALLPAQSQGGPADLGQEVVAVQLDWFLLPLFPLFDHWSPGSVFALLAAALLGLACLPWLGRRRDLPQQFQLLLQPGDVLIPARSGETILEAGLRAGLALPYECRNGACGLCLCTVRHGQVDHGPYQPATLNAEMRAQGKALMCCASPRDDLAIDVDVVSLSDLTNLPQRHRAEVVAIERLNPNVMHVRLILPQGQRLSFAAGQYLNVILEDGQRRAFSFANAPQNNAAIDLHIRRIPGGRFTTQVFEQTRVGDVWTIEAPLGRFTLHASQRPILLIAGATGFAPIKSILEDAFARGIDRPMHLYWGVRQPEDFYQLDLLAFWRQTQQNFHEVRVVSDAPADRWPGRRGLVHEAVLTDFPDLSNFEVYVCGSVQLVDAALPGLFAQGLGADACFSDAFHPALPATAQSAAT